MNSKSEIPEKIEKLDKEITDKYLHVTATVIRCMQN
jgi:hypothetical protein